LGYGAGHQLGEDIWGNTEFIHEDRFEEPDFLTVSPGKLPVLCQIGLWGRPSI